MALAKERGLEQPNQKHISKLIDAVDSDVLKISDDTDRSFQDHIALSSLPGTRDWLVAVLVDDDRNVDRSFERPSSDGQSSSKRMQGPLCRPHSGVST